MSLSAYLLFSVVLFGMGLFAVLTRRSLIGILIGVELMLNAASLNFIAFSRFLESDGLTGPIIVLFIIGLAAAEAAIALSIVVSVYRARGAIDAEELTELKG